MIIAFHGLQGSGKSTGCALIRRFYPYAVSYGIKSTFSDLADVAFEGAFGIGGADLPESIRLLAYKKMQRAISCCAEEFDANVWSNKFAEQVTGHLRDVLVLMDDCRTPQNLDALRQLSLKRPVMLFRLQASPETRKKRCSAWRDDNSYTEQLLARPGDIGNIEWHDIDAEQSLNVINHRLIELVTPSIEKWQRANG